MSKFVHLHLHSTFSPFSGSIEIQSLFRKAEKEGHSALALTDHVLLCGAVSFFKEAREAGIKPIIGCELFVKARQDKLQTDADSEVIHPLTILCRNEEGFRNLSWLSSAAHLKCRSCPPAIDLDMLVGRTSGLVVLSGPDWGAIPSALKDGDFEGGRAAALAYANLFEPGHFYLELIDHGLSWQKELNILLVEMGRELSLPVVATNNCHYLEREDAGAHEIVTHVKNETRLSKDMPLPQEGEAWLKGASEMAALFAWCPEAIENTIKIADTCSFKFDLRTVHFPVAKVARGESASNGLAKVASAGLENFFAKHGLEPQTQEIYRKRLAEELRIIESLYFDGYFLQVNEIVAHAEQNGIILGPGCGNVTASLVCFALGITKVDPVEFGLPFETFLDPEKISLPDIVLETNSRGRDELLAFLRQRYGEDHVAEFLSVERLPEEDLLANIADVLGTPAAQVERLLQHKSQNPGLRLSEFIASLPKLDPDFADVEALCRYALKMEGLLFRNVKRTGKVAVADKPIASHGPVFRGQNGELLSQYPLKDRDGMNLLTFDIRALECLDALAETLEEVAQISPEKSDCTKFPGGYHYLARNLREGQMSTMLRLFEEEFGCPGLREALSICHAETTSDLANAIAISKPGALLGGVANEYLERRGFRKPVEYPLYGLEGILGDTCGLVLYGEQVVALKRQPLENRPPKPGPGELRSNRLKSLIIENSEGVASRAHMMGRARLLEGIGEALRCSHHQLQGWLQALLRELKEKAGATTALLALVGSSGKLCAREMVTDVDPERINEDAALGLNLRQLLGIPGLYPWHMRAAPQGQALSLPYYASGVEVKRFASSPINLGNALVGMAVVDSLDADAFPAETMASLKPLLAILAETLQCLDRHESLCRWPLENGWEVRR